jgi:hypothetical protein
VILLEQQILEILKQLSPTEQIQLQEFAEALIASRSPQVADESLTEEKPTHKQKSRTIAQAILEVMQETNRPMSSQEICQQILDKKLYHFNTDNPLKMVRDALWRHDVSSGKRSSPNKYFLKDGKYWITANLINSNTDYPITEDAKEISMRELEESIYEYFLMTEFEEDIQL